MAGTAVSNITCRTGCCSNCHPSPLTGQLNLLNWAYAFKNDSPRLGSKCGGVLFPLEIVLLDYFLILTKSIDDHFIFQHTVKRYMNHLFCLFIFLSWGCRQNSGCEEKGSKTLLSSKQLLEHQPGKVSFLAVAWCSPSLKEKKTWTLYSQSTKAFTYDVDQ